MIGSQHLTWFILILNYFNRGRVRTVDNYGIPVLRTNYVTTDTTTTSVTYGVCPRLWRQLPCQGLFILHVTSTPASAATPTDLVFLDPTSFTNRQIDNTTTVITSRINKEKKPQPNVMKRWLNVRLSQISQE